MFSGRQVGFREVAVVVGVLLAALGDGYLALLQPAAGFLHYLAAVLNDATLAFHFVLQRLKDGVETVHVLDFGAGSEGVAAHGADADVGVAAKVAVLHIGGGDAEVLHEGVEGWSGIGELPQGERRSGLLTTSISGTPDRFTSTSE